MKASFLVVDKPEGWTSFDVVKKLRGVYQERRCGHTGTLDPMATGVLIVLFGRATRAMSLLEADDKTYVAGFLPGIITDTQDITGTVLSEKPPCTYEELVAALPSFTGEIQQIPPMYSAIKINGEKLYKIARKGGTVERQPRTIFIRSLSVCGEKDGSYFLRISCSKGTYIRTLVEDIGNSIGCGACLSSLRRESSGKFALKDAVSLQDIIKANEEGSAEKYLHPVDELFFDYPAVTLSAQDTKRAICGAPINCSMADGLLRVYGDDDAFLMVAACRNQSLRTVRSFFEVE